MKAIRWNVPSNSDKAAFDARRNYTLHTGGLTVYFEEIRDERCGFVFVKSDTDVAFVSESECDVSPIAAKDAAEGAPNEKIPFSDD